MVEVISHCVRGESITVVEQRALAVRRALNSSPNPYKVEFAVIYRSLMRTGAKRWRPPSGQ
jgi:hypothetical protein